MGERGHLVRGSGGPGQREVAGVTGVTIRHRFEELERLGIRIEL